MDEKTFAQNMRVARFVVRVLIIVAIAIGACHMGYRLCSLVGTIQRPAACTAMTEEIYADKQDQTVGDDDKSSKDTPMLQKRIIKEESSWVQFAHSTLLLGSQAVVFAILVWGIVTVTKHDD